jgi:hypothetical protein
MTSDFFAITAPATTERAFAVLDDLMARVGVDGLTAAIANPGVLAAVDQHGAEIREAVRRSGRPLEAESLAGYATSIAAAVVRMGRELPEPGEVAEYQWATAEWHLMRLVAVCAIAEENDWL